MTDANDKNRTDDKDLDEVTPTASVEPEAEGKPEGEEEAVAEAEEAEEVEEETPLERLGRELEEAQAQAAEYLDGWQRAQAEFANYRKRQEAEWQQRAQMSNAGLVAKILPVLDDLERAALTLPLGLQRLTWIEGFLLVKRKLEMVLESEGVRPIETEGKTFDPLYHEAVTYEEVEGYEDGQIIEVQRGYTLGDRVVRPALVRVARAAGTPSESDESADAGQPGKSDP